MDRTRLVAWLTTNCEHWVGAEATLNSMTDGMLTKLKTHAEEAIITKKAARVFNQVVTKVGVPAEMVINEVPDFIASRLTDNAVPPQFRKKKVETDDEEEDMEDDEEEEPTKKKKYGGKMSENLSMEEWLSVAPADAREVWNQSVEVYDQTRNQLIRQLTSHLAPERREVVANKLGTKTVNELKEIVELQGGSTNNNDGTVNGFRMPGADYSLGAGGSTRNSNAVNADQNDFLAHPQLDYEEIANEQRKEERARTG